MPVQSGSSVAASCPGAGADQDRLRRTSYRSAIGSLCLRLSESRFGRDQPVRVAFALGLIPFSVGVGWMVFRLRPSDVPAARWIVVSSAVLWMLLAPVLMTWGQTWVESLLRSADEDARASGISMDDAYKVVERIDRMVKPMSFGFAAVVALVFLGARSAIPTYVQVPLGPGELVVGLVLFSFVGLTSGEGVWGVFKTVVLERALTRIDWPWYPFEPWPIETLRKLGRYSYTTALIFSAGALFLPMTLALFYESDEVLPRAAALFGVLVLSLGSSVLFVYPYWQIHRLAQRQRQSALRTIGESIECSLPPGLRRSSHEDASADAGSGDVEAMLAIWTRMKDEPVSPIESLGLFVRRFSSTLVLPVLVVVVSTLVLRG